MSSQPIPSPPMTSVLDRFLRYVRYDTQSDEGSTTYPSTARQLVLLRELARELRELGFADADVDAHGYVMATIPPTAGWCAHADHRLHRARRYVARNERRRRPADRAPRLRRPRSRASGRSVGRPAARRRIRPSPSRWATTSSPHRARRCSAPTTRRGSRKSSPRPST